MKLAADIGVLIACEQTGTVRQAFRDRGFNAWSCDKMPAEDKSPYHIQGDARFVLTRGWNLLIAHPPCTYLANSGGHWLMRKEGRYDKMLLAAEFFSTFLNCSIPHIAVENPIPHKYAVSFIGRKYDQIIQPWQFGHPETKATCLWLKTLPPLQPTNIREERSSRLYNESPGGDRAMIRAATFRGIAEAMADQWGRYLLEEAA